MTWTPDQKRVVQNNASLKPIPHAGSNAVFDNGWGGCNPLPVMTIPHGFQSVWIVPRKLLKNMRRNGGAISVVVIQGDDGKIQMSITAPDVHLTGKDA